MPVTINDLRDEVGAGAGATVDAKLTRCLAEATKDVTEYLEGNLDDVSVVPTEKQDQALLVAAADNWYLSEAPNGIVNQQFDVGAGEVGSTPIRIGRDPLRSVRPVLSLWIGPAIG